MELETTKTKVRGIDVSVVATVIEMPWGSVYWMLEVSMERPVLPHIFRRIGERDWVVVETTLDAAYTKLEECIEEALK